MRSAFLVALREYTENAKTKGFWIGIFMLPLIFSLSIFVQQALDKAEPTRTFVLVDASGGELEQTVTDELDSRHRRRVLRELSGYVRENADDVAAAESEIERWSQQADESHDPKLEDLLERISPHLREDAPEFEEPRAQFRRVPLPAGLSADTEITALAGQLKPYLRGEVEADELFAAILIPPDVFDHIVRPNASPGTEENSSIQYWSSNLAVKALRDSIQSILDEEIRRREYVERGMDADIVHEVQKTRIPFESLNPKKAAGEEKVSMADIIRQWAPVAFVYLLWIAIFTISQMLLNNTIEEKSNRIIEVLLSSVTAGELMLGKLAGIAAVGLTMLTAWIGSAVLALGILKEKAEFADQIFDVLSGSGLLPAFAVYFILGYLLYSGIFLAIGSVCNTLKEAQNMMGPVMLIMIVPLFTMMFIPKDPNGTLATIMSWIPLYTPFVMMNRAAADPPLFDLVGTLVLLLITTVTVLWLTGKIFRAGVLRTGQPPKLLELLRWVRN